MTTISPEDEDIARTLMHAAVSDIHVGYSLVDRVAAGTRRRKRRWPLLLLPAAVMLAGSAAGTSWYVVHHASGSPGWPMSAQPEREFVCATQLPGNWLTDGIPVTSYVADDGRVLVPGAPNTVASCAVDGSGIAMQLPVPEESAVLRALQGHVHSSPAVGPQTCTVRDEALEPLYFVFEYPDGTQLSVVAEPTTACGTSAPVIWAATNSVLRVQILSPELDALGAQSPPVPPGALGTQG